MAIFTLGFTIGLCLWAVPWLLIFRRFSMIFTRAIDRAVAP